MEAYWDYITDSNLRQGDYLPDCYIPDFGSDFSPDITENVPIDMADLIILTQSCDLEDGGVNYAALAPIYSIEKFKEVNSRLCTNNNLNLMRSGRIEGLYLLASQRAPSNCWQSLIVDFREIYTLPVGYLANHARDIGERWRLRSPYLEHFSQAFARFYMRVGLPSRIPKFTSE